MTLMMIMIMIMMMMNDLIVDGWWWIMNLDDYICNVVKDRATRFLVAKARKLLAKKSDFQVNLHSYL